MVFDGNGNPTMPAIPEEFGGLVTLAERVPAEGATAWWQDLLRRYTDLGVEGFLDAFVHARANRCVQETAAPAFSAETRDTTQYLSLTGASQAAVLTTPGVQALSFYVGSLDSYNSFTFQLADGTSQVVTGAMLAELPAVLSDRLRFAVTPAVDSATSVSLVRMVGERSRDARRVEVSFQRIAPRTELFWSDSTAEGINLPIGRAGAARLQYLRLGRGTSQHVLIAGKTGSGKSTLMHILVTNLALHYSPDEIEFYLVDFKKGVEFRKIGRAHV